MKKNVRDILIQAIRKEITNFERPRAGNPTNEKIKSYRTIVASETVAHVVFTKSTDMKFFITFIYQTSNGGWFKSFLWKDSDLLGIQSAFPLYFNIEWENGKTYLAKRKKGK